MNSDNAIYLNEIHIQTKHTKSIKEVMATIGVSGIDEDIAVAKADAVVSNETYLVFNANELMGKGYDIFETNKVKYLSAKMRVIKNR
jgi:hypothetical protein